jgi:hypothetical protein
MTRTRLLSALAVLALPTAAAAQTSAYEGFGYPPGSTVNAQSGGTGFWGGPWNTNQTTLFTIQAGSLTPPAGSAGLVTTGNALTLGAPPTGFSTATRPIPDLAAVNGGQVWVSFLIRRTGGPAFDSFGGLMIGTNPGSGQTADLPDRIFIGDPGFGDLWSLERAGGGAAAQTNFGVIDDQTVLLVVHLDIRAPGTADPVRLYVNPALTGTEPVSPSASLLTLDLNGPTAVFPAGAPVNGLGVWYGNTTYVIDEIRFGSSYAEVTPVPEPAAGLALAAGVLAAGGWLRRAVATRPPGR